MKSNRFVRLASALLAPLLVAGAVVAQAGAASADVGRHSSHVLYVSRDAKPSNSDRSCRSAAFRTIQSAVSAAPAGGTVVVCRGTYHEQVVITKPLSLAGQRATIDETGVTPTFQVTVPGLGTQTIFAAVIMVSSHITFTGFTIRRTAEVRGPAEGARHALRVRYGCQTPGRLELYWRVAPRHGGLRWRLLLCPGCDASRRGGGWVSSNAKGKGRTAYDGCREHRRALTRPGLRP
jgi:hypothetical protein